MREISVGQFITWFQDVHKHGSNINDSETKVAEANIRVIAGSIYIDGHE